MLSEKLQFSLSQKGRTSSVENFVLDIKLFPKSIIGHRASMIASSDSRTLVLLNFALMHIVGISEPLFPKRAEAPNTILCSACRTTFHISIFTNLYPSPQNQP